MKKSHHKVTSKTTIWTPKIRSNTTSSKTDYFSQKKLKFQMTNYGQNEKFDVSKAFTFRIYNVFYLRAASKSIRRLKKLKKHGFSFCKLQKLKKDGFDFFKSIDLILCKLKKEKKKHGFSFLQPLKKAKKTWS